MEVILINSDTIGLAGLFAGIVTLIITAAVGIPTVRHISAQTKEMRRKKRDEIGDLLRGKNWNNLGIDLHPFPAITIEISSIDTVGLIRGTITNCASYSLDPDIYTFGFSGKLDYRGKAIINLHTQIGWREVNVGLAKIKYCEEDNTLDYCYLNDHKDNPTMSHKLSLPRFITYGLVGC
jgi:hypothetical protein